MEMVKSAMKVRKSFECQATELLSIATPKSDPLKLHVKSLHVTFVKNLFCKFS